MKIIKLNTVYTFLFVLLIFLNFSLSTKSSSKLRSKQVLTSTERGSMDGEVVIACSECQKIVTKFILNCVDQEANGNQVETLHSFCEASRDKQNLSKRTRLNYDYCMILNDKLIRETGSGGTDLIDPAKSPGLCMKFQNECNLQGGAPKCYSGFCERVGDCIDCPTAIVDTYKDGELNEEVCGKAGVCRVGWMNDKVKAGNGYCECFEGMKGLACNLF